MIKEVRVQSVADLMPLITEQEYRKDLDRYRSPFLYRGIPDADYQMTTSLRRNCKGLQKTLELAILNNFAKDTRTVLLLKDDDAKIKRAGRNIPTLHFLTYNRLCAHDLFYARKIIMLEGAAKNLSEFYAALEAE